MEMGKKKLMFAAIIILTAGLFLSLNQGVFSATPKAPQAGGTLTLLVTAQDPDKWDPIEYSKAQEDAFVGFYAEGLLAGDLQRGARGTNEYWFNDAYWVPDPYIKGHLAASWEFVEPLTVKFTLRQGIMWPE